MNLGLAIADSNIAEPFQVLRSSGQFVAGGFQDTKTTVGMWGNVSLASPQDLDMAPEADRVTGAIAVWSQQEIFVTRASPTPGTSDIVVWQGEQYRVSMVMRYPRRGYWKAVAVRMAGR